MAMPAGSELVLALMLPVCPANLTESWWLCCVDRALLKQTVPLVSQQDEVSLNILQGAYSSATKSLKCKVSVGNINTNALIFQRGHHNMNAVM